MSLEDKNKKGRELLIQLLKSGKTVDVTAQGLSMFPVLLPDDILRVKPVKPEQLLRGQIIVYEKDSKIISHRYIKTVNGEIICKGDGLIYNDAPFNNENLLGVVVARIRKNNTILFNNRLKLFSGLIITYLTPFTGLFFHYLSFAWHKWIYQKQDQNP